ncbi:MAG TPA: ABC transporter permease [Devosia sp.]|nr:ABC transporter permease [Devosia sp.]
MTDQAPAARSIPDRLSTGSAWWKRWETILVVVAVAIFIANSFASPYFLDPSNLSLATFNFTETAMIGFAMAPLIVAGEIDLSVAGILALSSTAMGAAATAGAPTPLLVLIGLAVGVAAGAVNGFIVTRFRVPSIVVTIGTMSLYRGIAYVVLGDQVYRKYPPDFAWFGQGYVVWVFSFEFVLFLVLAIVFGVLLHLTTFGRRIYAIGNNPVAAQFSGVRVDRIRFTLFMLTGLMSGVAGVLLTSRIGSTRPTIATGYELQAITMVVLGGVNILGGSGTILGVVIAAFIMGLVTLGLGLLNVPGIVQSIVTGGLLIVVIAIPILWNRWRRSARQ